MKARPGSYTAYSVGCAVVWAVILGVVAARDTEKFRTILPVFGGWWMGWTSATIARYVHPPPRPRGGTVPSRVEAQPSRPPGQRG